MGIGSIVKGIAGSALGTMGLGTVLSMGGELLGMHAQRESAEDSRAYDQQVRAADLAESRRVMAQNEALQREFAQHGIRWRVEDAKAAGLHPLFAAGGSAPGYSPAQYVGSGGSGVGSDSSVGDSLSRMGQSLSRAVLAQETVGQVEERKARLALMASQAGEADARAMYYLNEAARTDQEKRSSARMPAAVPVGDVYLPQYTGRITPKPDEVISTRSGDRSVTAAPHAGHREYIISRHGTPIRLPYSEEGPGEALENVPWWMWPAIVQHNRSYYGSEWGSRLMREFVFDDPKDSPSYLKSYDPRSGRRGYGGSWVDEARIRLGW